MPWVWEWVQLLSTINVKVMPRMAVVVLCKVPCSTVASTHEDVKFYPVKLVANIQCGNITSPIPFSRTA